MDEKLKKIIFIVLGAFFLLFLFLFILTSCNKKLKPQELEKEIISSVKKYYRIHDNELPQEDNVMTISLSDLATKGIIKSVDKLVDKNTTCSGVLTIENNNNYYMYSPEITCTSNSTSYITENLKDTLLDNVVTSGNGLYKVGASYYFKGDDVNNQIIFDGIVWRIVSVNEDNSIKLIEENRRKNTKWDDRYNVDRNSTTGINEFIYDGINSRIKDYLDDVYKDESVLSNDAKGYIKKTTLCIGKRTEEDTEINGSIECSRTLNDQYIGLLQVNEYMLGSLDKKCTTAISLSCSNYNYLANFSNSYWTITADATNTHKVFKINTTAYSTNANNSGMGKIVINISENTNVTGSGSTDDPYIVVGTDTEIKNLDK